MASVSCESTVCHAPEQDDDPTKTHMVQPALANGELSDKVTDAEIERLGRVRPVVFHSAGHEVAFVFSMVMSQFLMEYYTAGFTVLVPSLINHFNITPAAAVWPTTVYSLVVAGTLLIYSKLCDMWGGYVLYLWGLVWLLVWSVIGGFSVNPLMLIFCRALQGFGSGVFEPAGIMLLGSVYRPGPRKNLVFSLLGASSVSGFFIGVLFAGLVAQFAFWGWFCWIGAIFSAITIVTSILYVPHDRQHRLTNGVKFDWLGAITSFSAIILIVFAITQSSTDHAGWRTPYIPILFCLGMILLGVTVYIEGWIAEQPLIPLDIFANRTMIVLLVALFLIYGDLSILLLYGTQYFIYIMKTTPIQVVAWYIPLAVGGLAISLAEGLLLHRMPGQVFLVLAGLGALGSQLLLVFLPSDGNYWAWIFPATILGTISIDMSYNVVTVFVSTQFTHERQGLAGGVMGVLLQLGVAMILGFASIVQSYTSQDMIYSSDWGNDQSEQAMLSQSYKDVFWFGTGVGALALILLTLFGRVPRAQSDLTANEKAIKSQDDSAEHLAEDKV